jgi:hypothetical protein
MIHHLPSYIALVFGLTTVLTLLLFVWAINDSKIGATRKMVVPILIGCCIWLLLQATLTIKNIYNTDTNTLPPKIFLFGILPTIFVLILVVFTQKGRAFMDSLPLKNLTYLNMVRIPVEIVLFWLFLRKTIPQIMTFEGRNFDILAGITAPIIAYLGFVKTRLSHKVILIWHFIALGLLLNIVIIAFLSAPTPLQQFGVDQPNIALLNFPFSWLPTFIVPIVLFGHLTAIRKLLK